MRERRRRWLCGREIQLSIRDSVHLVLRDEIERQGLGNNGTGEFTVTDTEIRHRNGGLIIFRGLHSNLDSLKSIEGLDGFWIEEAQSVSQASLDYLIPTVIRNEGAECWFSFNPATERDPVWVEQEKRKGRPDTVVIEINLEDNPWASPAMFEERATAYRTDPDRAAWIWGGKFLRNSTAQVFASKWRVEAFEAGEDWDGPYFGQDFGFSQDPCTAVEVYIHERQLWIRRAIFKVGLDIDLYPAFLDRIPGTRLRPVRCDCSRPESISYLQQHGFPQAMGAKKWAGSVEDGIAWLRSHEAIVIHPDCPEMIEEAQMYSFKEDKRTGDVLPAIVDKWNHGWDAVRYACEPMISGPGDAWGNYIREMAGAVDDLPTIG